jgi:hypothetical protein
MAESNQKMALATQASQQKQVDAQQRNADMAARTQANQRDQVFRQNQAAMKPFPTVR